MTQDYFTCVDAGAYFGTGGETNVHTFYYTNMELDHTDITKNFVVIGLHDEETSNGTFPKGNYHCGMSLVYDGVQESDIVISKKRGSDEYFQFEVAAEGSTIHATLALNWHSLSGGERVKDGFPQDNNRITGVRIYIRQEGQGATWSLLIDGSLTHGVRQSVEEGVAPGTWYNAGLSEAASGTSTLTNQQYWIKTANQKFFVWPSETYENINGHASGEINYAFFKTALIANRRTWIGNVFQNGRHYPDRVMYSPVDQYDKFPELNFSPIVPADGDEIVKIMFNDDRIFVFKKHTLFVLNVSQDGAEYLEATYNGLGASSKSEVCKVEDGIAWLNHSGVYHFNGQKVNRISQPIDNLWYRKGTTSSSANVVSNDFSLQDQAISGTRTGDANYTFYSGNSAIGYDALSKKS